MDGNLLNYLAYIWPSSKGNYRDKVARQFECFQRAMDIGHTSAYFWMSSMYTVKDLPGFPPQDMNKAIAILMEAGEKGVKDDRVLLQAIDNVYTDLNDPKADLLVKYKSKDKLALYICDLLIQGGAAEGYYRKGLIHYRGVDGGEPDIEKAVAIWKEAEQVGLATYSMYVGIVTHVLLFIYTYTYIPTYT